MPSARYKVVLLAFLLLAWASPILAEHRIVVHRAQDPKEILRSEIRCSIGEQNKILGSGDFDGDGKDELFIETSGEELRIYDVSETGCSEQSSFAWGDFNAGRVLGAFDSDADGVEELFVVSREGKQLQSYVLTRDSPTLSFNRPIPETHTVRTQPAILFGGTVYRSVSLAVLNENRLQIAIFTNAPIPFARAFKVATFNIKGVHSLLGTVHSTTGSQDKLLLRYQTSPSLTHFGFDGRPVPVDYYRFPFEGSQAVRSADLNGDGLSEVLYEYPGILGLWISMAVPQGQIEFPLAGLQYGDSLTGATVGDFDGDGDDEVLFTKSPTTMVLLSLTAGSPFPKVSISIDNEHLGSTDEKGTFSFSSELKLATITARSDQGTESTRTVRLSAHDRRPIRLLVVDPSNARTDHSVYGFTAANSGPYLCLGYNPAATSQHPWQGSPRICPENHVILSVDDGDKKALSFRTECCRLPDRDILSHEHRLVTDHCPENFVATGIGKESPTDPRLQLHCTKLNTDKYHLAKPQSGQYWGAGYSYRSFASVLAWHELPVGIRYAAGRLLAGAWDGDGCVGSPIGSIYVGGMSSSCAGVQFAELLRAESGARVQLLPSCSLIDSFVDPRSGCR